MPSIILWIYCVFFGSLGVFTQSTSAVTYIKMNATSHDTCQVTDAENVTRYNWTFTVGDAIKLSFSNRLYINEVSCSYLHEHPILEDRNAYLGIRRESKIFIAYKNMSAVWKCRMLTNRNVKGLDDATIRTENGTFVETVCEFNLIVKDIVVPDPVTPMKSDNMTMYIYIGVGVIVLIIIIIGQTGVILYIKAKARKMARIRRISQRASSPDEDDKTRYITDSAPTQRRGVIATWLAKRRNSKDDDIYETLEELRGQDTPPVPPIENIPTLTRKDKLGEKDVSKRPPLPLPSETAQEETQTNTMEKNAKRPQIPTIHETEKEDSPPPQKMAPFMAQTTKPGPFGPTVPGKPKTGHVSMAVVSELDNKLKLRKPSMVPGGAPSPPKKPETKTGFKRVSFLKRNSVQPESDQTPMFQLPEKPNPMPTGKSAILLGLSPTPPKPLKPVNSKALPAAPGPVGTIAAFKIPLKPPVENPSPLFPNIPGTLPKATEAAPKPTTTPPKAMPLLPKPPPSLPKTTPKFPKPQPSVDTPVPSTSKSTPPTAKPQPPTAKPPPPTAKPPPPTAKPTPFLPKTTPTFPKPSAVKNAENLAKSASTLPKRLAAGPKAADNMPKAADNMPKAAATLPKPKAPRPAPKEEPDVPHLAGIEALLAAPKLAAPPTENMLAAPVPVPGMNGPPTISKPPIPAPVPTEALYEEYEEYNEMIPEEPEVIYNSDEEWTYEPLPKYNIYSA